MAEEELKLSQGQQSFLNDGNLNPKKPNDIATTQQDFLNDTSPGEWTPKERRPIGEQLKRAYGLYTTETMANLRALPRAPAELVSVFGHQVETATKKRAERLGREITPEQTKPFTEALDAPLRMMDYLGEKFPSIFPTYQQAKEQAVSKVKKMTGIETPEKPETGIEKIAVGVGKAAPALIYPEGAGILAATSAAGEVLELSEKQKMILNLAAPAAIHLIDAVASGRYIPPPGEAEALYNRGRALGLSDEQLAPIFATEEQVASQGPIAAGSRATRQAFEATHEALGGAIQDVENSQIAFTPVAMPEQQALLNRLRAIRANLSQPHAQSPQSQGILTFLDETIESIENAGTDPHRLMRTWRQVNRVRGGRTALRQMLPAFEDAIESVSPQLGQDFRTVNQLYGRFLDNLGEINPSAYTAFMEAGDMQNLLGSIFSMDPSTVAKGVWRHMSTKAFQRISSAILTDPRAQSLARNFGRAVRDGRAASARAVGLQLKEYVKDKLPEDYKEIEWEEIGL